jgi:tetratricopeptide (TPR) repeat protein
MYQTGRRFNEARDMYVAAVAADSNFAPALLDLGDLMRLAKKPEVAVQLYMRYLGQAPRDIDAMLHISQACLDIGKTDQAATTAADAMKINPSRPDVRRNFVRCGLRSSDPEMGKAATSVFNGMANDPTWTAEDWLLLAEYHRQGGRFDLAKDATARAATFDPTSPAVEYERGLIEMSAGNTAQAVTHLQAAATAKPDAPGYHLNLGIALIKAERKADGLASMRRALAVNPQYTQGRLVLAQSLAAMDSVQAGNDQYRAILAYDPTNGPANCGLGWSAVRIADCKEARRLFQSVVDNDPKNAEGWAGLGSAEVCAANLPAATAALDRARQIDPQNVNVKRGLDLLARARNGSAP